MRILHYLEIENFKRFGERQRIELDHPAVLIGPNNSGKTTVLQAIVLWSQAVQAWWDTNGAGSSGERPSVALNRLAIVSVPVVRTRHFFRDLVVRRGNRQVAFRITAGVEREGRVESVGMRFRNYGEDLVYCFPDEATREKPDRLRFAAGLKVDILYPQSGLKMEEPVLQPRRIRALLGEAWIRASIHSPIEFRSTIPGVSGMIRPDGQLTWGVSAGRIRHRAAIQHQEAQ